MFPFSSLFRLIIPLNLTNHSWSATDAWPDSAQSGVRVATDAGLDERRNDSYISITDEWVLDSLKPSVDASNFECAYFDVTGDTGDMLGLATSTTGGTENWYAVTSNREWSVVATGTQFGPTVTKSVTGTLKIREIANPTNEATATITLEANALNGV